MCICIYFQKKKEGEKREGYRERQGKREGGRDAKRSRKTGGERISLLIKNYNISKPKPSL